MLFKAGAFIHGMAGDIAEERHGQWGMTSVDIEEALPQHLKNSRKMIASL